MLGTHDLALFIVSGLLLNVTPGADSLYIATRSATQGLAAGVCAVLGIGLGCCVHVLAAALGLSAVLASSAYAFSVVKLIGAAYLVYVGVSMLRARPAQVGPTRLTNAPLRTIIAQGFLTNVLNPKVALFFLAFVPQFILPSAANKPLAFIFLGAIFTLNGVLWCLFLAWAAARVGALGIGGRAALWFGRGIGALFVTLGLRLAFAERA